MSDKPAIKYGFRGEDIQYSIRDRTIWISFTWCKGARIYPDSIKRWDVSKEEVSAANKKQILEDVIAFVNTGAEKPFVTINSDDPDRELWESVCKTHESSIQCIEYTLNTENAESERQMFLGILKAGKELTINDREIKNERDLDEYLRES